MERSFYAIAAGPFAAVQALIPTVQLRVLIIVGAGVTDCRNRRHDSEYNKRCMPDVIAHLTPNPGISLCSQEIHPSASTCEAFSARRFLRVQPRTIAVSRSIERWYCAGHPKEPGNYTKV